MIAVASPERCERCGDDSLVVNGKEFKTYRWRRRECVACGHRWSTYETRLNVRRIRHVVARDTIRV